MLTFRVTVKVSKCCSLAEPCRSGWMKCQARAGRVRGGVSPWWPESAWPSFLGILGWSSQTVGVVTRSGPTCWWVLTRGPGAESACSGRLSDLENSGAGRSHVGSSRAALCVGVYARWVTGPMMSPVRVGWSGQPEWQDAHGAVGATGCRSRDERSSIQV
jgi:hypothetical protein